jgi:hypothetical protein
LDEIEIIAGASSPDKTVLVPLDPSETRRRLAKEALAARSERED